MDFIKIKKVLFLHLRFLILLSGLLFLFFHEVFLEKKSILPLSNLYFDALYQSERPEGLSYVLHPNWDISPLQQNFPFDILAWEQLKKGNIPLWNPYNGAGGPLLANGESATFSYLKWIIYLFTPLQAYNFYLLSILLCAGYFTYLFLKRLGISELGACIAGISFCFSGWMIREITFYHSATASLLPLLLLSSEMFVTSLSLNSIILLTVIVSMVIYSGHPIMAFYLICASILYIITRTIQNKKYKKGILFLLLAGILSFCISSPFLIPFLEALQNGFVYKFRFPLFSFTRNISLKFSLYNLSSIIFPRSPFSFLLGYVGFGTLITGTLGVLSLKTFKDNLKKYLPVLIILLFSLGTSFEIPPFSYLFIIAGFGWKNPIYAYPVFSLSICTFAGIGIDRLLSDRDKEKRKLLFISSFFLFLFLIAFVYTIFFYPVELFNKRGLLNALSHINLFLNSFKPDIIIKYLPGNLNIIRFILSELPLFISLIFFTIVALIRPLYSHKYGIIILTSVMVAELFFYLRPVNPPCPNFNFNETPPIKFLKNDNDIFRVIGLNGSVHLPNLGTITKIHDIRAQQALQPERYANFMLLAFPDIKELLNDMGVLLMYINNGDSPFLDLMNIKYIILNKHPSTLYVNWDTPPAFLVRFITPQYPDNEKLEKVYNDDNVVIYKNKDYFPRTFFRKDVIFVDNKQESLQNLMTDFSELRTKVIIEEKDTGKRKSILSLLNIKSPTPQEDNIEILKYEPEEVYISVNLNSPGFLVLGDIYYPGWKAYIDGRETKIYPANYIQRAIFIEGAGHHNILFRYEPKSFKIGFYLFLFALSLILLFYSINFVVGKN